MLKLLTLLIVLMTMGCAGSDEVVMPENPTPLPPKDVPIGTGSATDDAATPPPLATPGE